MEQLFRKFKQIAVLILAIAFIGCEDDDANLPEVVAGFTYTINADTGTVTFINTSENATSYSWDLGDGTTTTLIDPVKAYPNGTYIVVLTASNVAGASDVFEDTITISIPEIATLPITFDGANTTYDPDVFGGTSFDVVDNPDESGTNPNATKVGEVTNIGEAFEGISFGLGADIDLTTGGSISMNFWADAPVDVLTKLEEGTGGDLEATASHGGTGWETIIFTFSSSDSYPRLTIFVDGPGETAGTFYMDDITQIETPPLPCVADTAQSFAASSFNISFETDPGTTETVGETDKLLLGDVGYEYLDNPDFDNAVNSSCKVSKIDKAAGFDYANVQIFTADKFNLTDNAGFKLKIFSPNVGTNVLFKLEDTNNGGVVNQVSQLTSIANGWEELTFDFPESDTNKFDRIIIFFGFEQGDALTVHFDELKTYTRSGGGGGDCVADTAQSFAASSFNISFETDPGTAETVGETDKLLLGDVGYEYLDNPDFDNAVNSSCKVSKIDKAAGFDYANVQIFTADKFNLTDNAGFKLKIFSPNVGTNVLFKLEDTNNGGVFNQVSQLTSIANGWEELTFDFPESDTNKFDRIIIFFGFEQGDALTVHFDELKTYTRSGGGGGDCVADTAQSFAASSFNISFETDPGTTETVGETDKLLLGDVGYEYLDNPDFDNAVNSSCKVSKIDKAAGFDYANVQIFTADKFNLTDNAGFKLKIFSPNVGTNVLFKLEDTNNGGVFNQVSQLTSIANGWEELTFDFPESDTNKFDRIIIFFGFEQGDALTVHFDELKTYTRTGGGGGGGEIADNGDFETGNLDGWAVYPNGGIIIADNTENNGGTWSGKIVASAPSGLNPTLKQERKGAGSVSVGDTVQISFDYKGTSANGGIYDIRSFVEAADGVNQTEIFSVTPTGTWQNFTTTYTVSAGDISGGITMQFGAICGGVDGCSSTLYLDNVSIILNP